MKRLQALYDSEINFSISCFWDGGFDFELGDTDNGIKESFTTDTLEEGINELCAEAIDHFPQSRFAKDNSCPTL